MKHDGNSPRRLQSAPVCQRHDIESLIERLNKAKPIYEAIVAHQKKFAADAASESAITRAGRCKSMDPQTEWCDVTDQPVHVMRLLEKQGLIATIKVGSRYYSRPSA